MQKVRQENHLNWYVLRSYGELEPYSGQLAVTLGVSHIGCL